MSENTLYSLSILKVLYDSGQDYIQNFVPFIVECLKASSNDEVSLEYIQEKVRELFGINIPGGALKTILNRTAKEGFLKKEGGIYKRAPIVFKKPNITEKREDLRHKQNEALEDLINFTYFHHKLKWTYEEAESALLSYLTHNTIPVLTAIEEGAPIPHPEKVVKNSDFIINSFVNQSSSSESPSFKFIETIVKGYMLSNVLYYPDIGKVKKRFENVGVYFDTRFVLRALGYAGNGLKKSCSELIELLYTLNADLYCFEHTIGEIKGILFRAANDLKHRENLKYS